MQDYPTAHAEGLVGCIDNAIADVDASDEVLW